MHSTTKTLIGIVQAGFRRYPIKGQKNACARANAKHIVELGGKNGYTLKDVWSMARPEVEFCCQYAFLLAPVKGRIEARRALLLQFDGEISARGSTLWEIEPGRRTDDAKQRSLIYADAMTALAKRWQPSDGRKPGRRKQGSDADYEKARTAWFDLRYPLNEDAVAAFPKNWGGLAKAFREFGPSGRRKLRKAKRKL